MSNSSLLSMPIKREVSTMPPSTTNSDAVTQILKTIAESERKRKQAAGLAPPTSLSVTPPPPRSFPLKMESNDIANQIEIGQMLGLPMDKPVSTPPPPPAPVAQEGNDVVQMLLNNMTKRSGAETGVISEASQASLASCLSNLIQGIGGEQGNTSSMDR